MTRGLFSPGTKLAEVPPEARGLSWKSWEQTQWDGWKIAAAKSAQAAGDRERNATRPLSTARDRYGWRGMRSTSWIGPQEEGK